MRTRSAARRAALAALILALAAPSVGVASQVEPERAPLRSSVSAWFPERPRTRTADYVMVEAQQGAHPSSSSRVCVSIRRTSRHGGRLHYLRRWGCASVQRGYDADPVAWSGRVQVRIFTQGLRTEYLARPGERWIVQRREPSLSWIELDLRFGRAGPTPDRHLQTPLCVWYWVPFVWWCYDIDRVSVGVSRTVEGSGWVRLDSAEREDIAGSGTMTWAAPRG